MMVVETCDTIMGHSRCSHAKGKTAPFLRVTCPRFWRRTVQIKRRVLVVMWQRPKFVLRIFTCNRIILLGNARQLQDSQCITRYQQSKVGSDKHPRHHSLWLRRCFELAHLSCRGSRCSLAATSNRPSAHHVPIQRPRSPHFPPESALPRLPPYLHSPLYLHPSPCRRTSSLLALAVSNARASRTVLHIANDVDSVRLERCSHHLLGWRQCRSP
jgi:hypothetical protein